MRRGCEVTGLQKSIRMRIQTTLIILIALYLTVPAVQGQPTPAQDGIFKSLVDKGYEVLEFTVPVKGRQIRAVIASPPKDELAADPALLVTIGGASTHLIPPNDQPANYFWKHGHRVVSFSFGSMPGDLGILRDNMLKGPDPTLDFIADAQGVIDYCIAQKWVKSDRVVVTGISRHAYLAFRLLAADDRLKFGGGFAPVTDWRDLVEFKEAREQTEIAGLRLSNYVDQLAGRNIFLCIGSHDERVSTLSCCQFFLDLNEANRKRGLGTSLVNFYVTPDPGHTCGDEWFERGMEILLTAVTADDKK